MSDPNAEGGALWYARLYRSLGMQPLPSGREEKKPPMRYADHWEAPFPDGTFERWYGPDYPNVQVMTGAAWGLVVFDLDGEEAQRLFDGWRRARGCPRTWESSASRSSRHVWFTVRGLSKLASGRLWAGEGKHEAVERLADKKLVVAPPSRHVRHGGPYRWFKGRSPWDMARPAECPRWLLGMPLLEEKKERAAGYDPTWLERLDKVGLAAGWGLRMAGRERSSGWIPCHAFDRDDEHPSAAIHRESGYYVDSGTGRRLRFTELAVAMGRFASEQEAFDQLRQEGHLAWASR